SIGEGICMGRNPIIVRTWRIMDNITNDWVEQEYVIIVITKNYFGSRLIKVKPDKPFIDIEVKVHVRMKEEIFDYDLEWESSLSRWSNISSLVKDSTIGEEAIRVRKYLFMLESERRCGLISEKAYNRLKQKLESILFEILLGKEYEESGTENIIEAIISNPI
ncbi:MAG: hypothetical protein RMI79_06815, partial [Nitrososphaerota archaeon]|nr:hypothetical protein [Nitrososphaerota archaeon]